MAKQQTHQRPSPPPANTAPVKEFDPEFVFRLRRHKGGNFRNLWECTMLDPKTCKDAPVIKVLDDANALNYAMDNMQGEIEILGF